MIHTDGRPTIANAARSLRDRAILDLAHKTGLSYREAERAYEQQTDERSARIENLARDLAVAGGITTDEARARITAALRGDGKAMGEGFRRAGEALADTLASDDSALD